MPSIDPVENCLKNNLKSFYTPISWCFYKPGKGFTFFTNNTHRVFIVAVLSLLFLSVKPFSCFAYKDKPVVIILNRENQPDSVGQNFVVSFSELIYRLIESGKLKMWSGPGKNYLVSHSTLKGFELSSNTKFTETQNIFIYERWSSDRRETSFNIYGFLFMNTSPSGEDITYGFVDYADVAELCRNTPMKVNVDGYYKMTFHQVLMNKMYDYDILFFDNKPIVTGKKDSYKKDYEKNLKLKKQAFGSKKAQKNHVPVDEGKLVSYQVFFTDYTQNTSLLFSSLQEFFETNFETFRMVAGDALYYYFSKCRILVTECKVTEMWYRTEHGMDSRVVDVVFYSFGISYNKLTLDDLAGLNISVGNMPLVTFLHEKKFRYRLLEINENKILAHKSALYLKALRKAEWNRINEFVLTQR